MPTQQQNMEPISAGIMAGASLLGTGITAAAQGKMNKKTREWNEKMYALQRGHSLSDWAMQNEYNSPAQQMQRLKMAGLNPNMVYGKGTIDNQTGVVRGTEVKPWNPQAPEYNIGAAAQAGFSAYFNAAKQKQEIDNLKTINTVNTQDAAYKAAQTAATLQGIAKSKFELDLASELRQTSLEAAKASLRKMNIEADIALDRNDRETLKNNMDLRTGEINLQKTAVEILQTKAQTAKTWQERASIMQGISNLRKTNELQQIEINLRKQGVNPNDSMWERLLGQAIDGIIGNKNLTPQQQSEKNLQEWKNKGLYY
jgi:hypothetical protein